MANLTKEEYSPFKVFHHREILEQLSDGVQIVPLQVQVVPCNACNQRCSFCAYRMKDYLSNEEFYERDILPYEKIIETLDCFVEMGVKAVQYTGGGEPLVHPRAYDMLKETFDRGLEVALVTNGQALDEKTCDLLGDAAWVRVSVDANSPELYSAIRNVPMTTHAKVIENIKNLVKYRRKSTIGIGFVVQNQNYIEVFQAAKFFKELGVDNFRISASFTPEGRAYFRDFEKEAAYLCKMAESLSDENFTVFNLFDERLADTAVKQDYDTCYVKDLLSYVGADSNVYTCCTLAYNKHGLIGSIANQSFKDLWYSQEKIDKYAGHNPRTHCKHLCMYRNKNQFINYCTKKNPKHINFI